MKGSSKTLSRMLRRVVLLLLAALIMSPGQSRQLGNEHPQTGRRDGDPQVVVVDGRPGHPPPPPRYSEYRILPPKPLRPPPPTVPIQSPRILPIRPPPPKGKWK